MAAIRVENKMFAAEALFEGCATTVIKTLGELRRLPLLRASTMNTESSREEWKQRPLGLTIEFRLPGVNLRIILCFCD